MSNYVQSTNFATKDSLSPGDPLKIVKGTELNTEFVNIAVAVATKADLASPTFTGTPSLPTGTTGVTQSSGNSTTALATTAFVTTADALKADKTTTVSAGTGLSGGGDLSANRTLAIANTGVTAASYGSSTAIPVLAINAQGQVTSASTASNVLAVGAGSVSNNSTFSATTGPTGKVLIDVTVGVIANVGNWGSGTLTISIGGSSVATSTTNTFEYASRNSGDHGRAAYVYSGSANASVTVTVSWSGSGSFVEGRYSFVGI